MTTCKWASTVHAALPFSKLTVPSTAPVVAPQAAENSKRHWNPIEDATILSLVEQHGPRNWAKIASLLGTGRSGPSCCARWCRLAGPKAGAFFAAVLGST